MTGRKAELDHQEPALTPSTNKELPFRLDGFTSLSEGLDYAARGETGFNFYSPRGALVTVLPYTQLRLQALEAAKRLLSLDLKRGDRAAIIADTTPDFMISFFACQYAGIVPVPLPLSINLGGRESYIERLRGMMRAAEAKIALGPEELVASLKTALPVDAVFCGTLDELMSCPASSTHLEPLGPDDICYIQYSSGSTSFPRGVLVTQKAIVANSKSISMDGVGLVQGDRCVSWLPLYHDMGLVGCCLTPVLGQISVDYLPTSGFARRPLLWLKMMSQNRGTISYGPTFGFELCTRRAKNLSSLELNLSSWRVAGIGGEMIRPQALTGFAETFARFGFNRLAFLPSYGMAEATLAVTFTKLGEGVKTDKVIRSEAFELWGQAIEAPEGHKATQTREFARCGKPMPGYEIEIRDIHNRVLPERTVGRICIKGPSLMKGYFKNDVATKAAILDDGWLNSGDLGYMIGGELVVTGRSKDLIIIGGRNIWPQDIEWAVEHLDQVRSGDVAAFSVTAENDQEELVVLVECRFRDPVTIAEFKDKVKATVILTSGIDAKVVLITPSSLTFTTSGKLSRAAAKNKYLTGAMTIIDEKAVFSDNDDIPGLRAVS